MTPFFMLRVWLKRAPVANKAAAGIAGACAFALLVWIAVPGGSSSANGYSTLTQNGTAPGSTSGPLAGGSTTGPGSTTTGTGVGGGSSTRAGGSSTIAGGTGSGTTGGFTGNGIIGTGAGSSNCTQQGSSIKIGVILPNVGSGSASANGLLGVPPPSEQQAYYAAVFDDVNKHGGVQCHPLSGDYKTFNELDSSQTGTICLQFKQDKVYAVLGGFGPLYPDTCLLQNKIPTFEQIMLSSADAKKYYPYYFSSNGAYETLIKNFAYSIAKLGYVPGPKFKKLGVLLRNCVPSEMPAFTAALAANHVSGSQIDVYNFGCRSNLVSDPPNEISQAEIQFWRDGVTHVTAIQDAVDLQAFTNDANRQSRAQHWKPQYVVPDDGSFATISATQNRPNAQQFNGAVGITALQYGGIEAKLPESSATKRCDAIMTAHHQKTVYQSGDQFAGSPCALIWMLTAAMNNSPGLSQTGLAAGLNKVGTVDMSYPDGPNDFRAQGGVTWGGEYWRQDIYYGSCGCFKTVMPTFQKSF